MKSQVSSQVSKQVKKSSIAQNHQEALKFNKKGFSLPAMEAYAREFDVTLIPA